MLLSLPTWLIHLFSVSEWLVAILLIRRRGIMLARPELRMFANCMIPHLLGGIAILLFHLSADSEHWLLDSARFLTFAGSLLLLTATLSILLDVRRRDKRLAWIILPSGVAWVIAQGGVTAANSAAVLQASNLCYLAFLLTLLLVHRQARGLFSILTVSGFWFLLVFVAVTIFNTRIAMQQGYPTLSHDDFLHGLSESLLSISNLMIALGVYLQINRDATNRAPDIRQLDVR